MRLSSLCGTLPFWLSLIIVGLTAAALWGVLTVLASGSLHAVPREMRPLVGTLVSLGNIMTALVALAFWPLVTMAFWSTGALVAEGNPPEFRDLAHGVGLAHLPAMAGVLLVWIIVMATDLTVPAGVLSRGETRQYLESLTAVKLSRAIVASALASTGMAFIWVVRDLFETSWVRAAAIVTLPLSLYYCAIGIGPR